MQIFVRFFAQTQMAVWSVEWGYRAEPVASGEEESGDIQRCIYGKSADLWWFRARITNCKAAHAAIWDL